MSKKMLDVQNGTTFAVTKNGRVVAQMTPVSESLNESYDTLRISNVDSFENLLLCMESGETLSLTENNIQAFLIKK